MTTTVMFAKGTALCPKFDLDFTGTKDKAALDALDAKITAWSDGYMCSSTITLDTDFHAGASGPASATTGNLNLMYGAGLTTNLAASGAYYAGIGWSATAVNAIVPMMSFVNGVDGIATTIKDAGGFTEGDFGNDMTGGTDNWGYALSKPTTELAKVSGVDAWLTGSSLEQSFYMPTAVTGTAAGSTDTKGDRFDIEDTLAFYTAGTVTTRSSATIMDDKCASGVAMVMGAAAVAMTGVAAIASTLAI